MAVVRIQLRRDTAANWTSANPVLGAGEMGIETDTDQFKVGDGTTAWSSLAYGGIQGPAGANGTDGVVAATAPITYDAGTSTVGIDQTGISITASQLSDVTATAAELNVLDGITATTTELNYVDGVTSDVQTQLDGKAPIAQPLSSRSSNYTLQASDAGSIIKVSGVTTITIPANTFSAGERIDFIQTGTDTVTFSAGAGFGFLSKNSATTLAAQFSGATIVFNTATQGYLIGDLA